MVMLQNGSEGQTDGVAVSLGNSAASGDAYSIVSTSTAALTYSKDTAAHGTTSLKLEDTGDGSGNGWVGLGNYSPAETVLAARVSARFVGFPSAPIRLLRAVGAGADLGGFNLRDTGILEITNASGVAVLKSASPIVPDSWYRFEIWWNMVASGGSLHGRVFQGDDTSSPLLDYANDAIALSGSGITTVEVGKCTTGPTMGAAYFDDFAVDSGRASFIGPFAPAPVVNATLTEPCAALDLTRSVSGTRQPLTFTVSPSTDVAQPVPGIFLFTGASAGVQHTVVATDPGSGETATYLVTPDPYSGMTETVLLQSDGTTWA